MVENGEINLKEMTKWRKRIGVKRKIYKNGRIVKNSGDKNISLPLSHHAHRHANILTYEHRKITQVDSQGIVTAIVFFYILTQSLTQPLKTAVKVWGKEHFRWQNREEYKGKTNWAQSALARLLWLLYQPGSTHRPHMYPTPGRAWGMGVVRGCARAVLARPPSPLTPLC